MTDIATLKVKVQPEGIDATTRALDGLTNSVKALVAAYVSWGVAGMVKDAAMLAARYETLGVVMGVLGNNAGYSTREMQEFQKSLMATGISAIESLNTLNMMTSAQMDLSKSAQLARIAQDAAVIGNLNSSEAFQRMIYGIQSGQTEILRTIGINVNFENSYKALAKELKKTTAELTEREKTQARTNVVMEKGKDIAGAYEAAMGTTGKQVASLARYEQDLQVAVGDVFLPTTSAMVQEYTKALKAMHEWVVANKKDLDSLAGSMGATTTAVIGLGKEVLGLGSDAVGVVEPLLLVKRTIQGIGLGAALATDAIRGAHVMITNLAAESLRMFAIQAEGMSKFLALIPGQRYSAQGLDIMKTMMQGGAMALDARADKLASGTTSLERYMDALAAVEFGDAVPGRSDTVKPQAKLAIVKDLTKEYERQKTAVSGLQDELNRLALGEEWLLKIRVAQMGLTGKEQARANVLVQEILQVKAATKAEEERNEAFKERQRLMASIKPGQTTPYDDPWAKFAAGVESRYNPGAYAEQDLERLVAVRDKLSPQAFNKAFREIRAQGSATWAFLEDTFVLASDHMEDAMARFVTGTKMGWREMTNAMLADLARLGMQRTFQQLFGMIGGAWGGGASVATNTSFDSSGVGQGIPMGGGNLSGMRSAERVNVVVNVTNNGGQATVDASGGSDLGRKMGQGIKAAVRQVLAEEMRTGGDLWKRGLA